LVFIQQFSLPPDNGRLNSSTSDHPLVPIVAMHLGAGRIKVDAGFCGQISGPRIFEQGSVTSTISTGGKFQNHYLASAHSKVLPTTNFAKLSILI
jgi:hypothetical protein